MLFCKWEGPQSFHLRLRASANTSHFLSVRLWNHAGSTGRLAQDQRQDQHLPSGQAHSAARVSHVA